MSRFSTFATVSSDLVGRLVSCPPKRWAKGSGEFLPTFVVGSVSAKMPLKLKIRDRADGPAAGEVYHAHVSFRRQDNFVDEQTGEKCRSRDMWEVRMYLPKNSDTESGGELRLETFHTGSGVNISPRPLFQAILEGEAERGLLYVAEPGVEYEISTTAVREEVIFLDLAIIDLGEPEGDYEWVPEGVIRRYETLTVYDRRHNPTAVGVGKVKHVRRTFDDTGRVVEFMVVNHLPRGTGRINPAEDIHHVLTPAGLFPLSAEEPPVEDFSTDGEDEFVELKETLAR